MGEAGRRGEAHLWLVLEEALAAVQETGGASAVREVQRHVGYIAQALVVAGAIHCNVADAISQEFDDALVARRLLAAGSFRGQAYPVEHAASIVMPSPTGAATWLEAEIERHIDLVADFDPLMRPEAGETAIRILEGPLRAFEAAEVAGAARPLVLDLAASLMAAGFDAGPARTSDGRVRRDWVRFLRERPPPLAEHAIDADVRELDEGLGLLRGASVKVSGATLTRDRLDLQITIGRSGEVDPPATWFVRALDSRGRLHLGQPQRHRGAPTRTLTFPLRPGLQGEAQKVEIRVTAGSDRVEATIAL
jgi:hypothetical protein